MSEFTLDISYWLVIDQPATAAEQVIAICSSYSEAVRTQGQVNKGSIVYCKGGKLKPYYAVVVNPGTDSQEVVSVTDDFTQAITIKNKTQSSDVMKVTSTGLMTTEF